MLLGAELPKRTQPILHMESVADLAVLDGLNIDGHHPEALAAMRHAEQFAGGRTCHFATDNHTISSDQHFLDVEFHVWDRLGKAPYDLDRGVAAPTFARQIACAGFIV